MNKQNIKLDIINLVIQSEEEAVLKTVLQLLKMQQQLPHSSIDDPLANSSAVEDMTNLQHDIDEIFNGDMD
jgi:DNA-directed RNA polymerase subunit H (RpoH/RPB5)